MGSGGRLRTRRRCRHRRRSLRVDLQRPPGAGARCVHKTATTPRHPRRRPAQRKHHRVTTKAEWRCACRPPKTRSRWSSAICSMTGSRLRRGRKTGIRQRRCSHRQSTGQLRGGWSDRSSQSSHAATLLLQHPISRCRCSRTTVASSFIGVGDCWAPKVTRRVTMPSSQKTTSRSATVTEGAIGKPLGISRWPEAFATLLERPTVAPSTTTEAAVFEAATQSGAHSTVARSAPTQVVAASSTASPTAATAMALPALRQSRIGIRRAPSGTSGSASRKSSTTPLGSARASARVKAVPGCRTTHRTTRIRPEATTTPRRADQVCARTS
mmetsp:Transcript_33996/g.97947  ORF Transcript_33996/g.97947 Transcript_33996/m.97947 type:complete len:326 (-) Transcript_33996:1068-2045(-)